MNWSIGWDTYLKRNGIKQNAFFLDCIRQALAEDTGTAEE